MIIRDANADDVAAMLAIRNDVVATTTSIYDQGPTAIEVFRAWFDERVAAGWPMLVADDDGVIGFASFGPWRPRWGYRLTVEHSVHVRADRRGAGVGRALLERLIALASEGGYHTMIAMIDADAAASIALHRKLGFDDVGRFREISHMRDRWLDLVAMQLMIETGDREPAA